MREVPTRASREDNNDNSHGRSGFFFYRSASRVSSPRSDPPVGGCRAFGAKVLQDRYFLLGMGLVILANVCLIVYETDAQTRCDIDILPTCERNDAVFIVNNVFLGIYTVEVLLRIYTFRLRTFVSTISCLDLIIVLAGYLDLFLNTINVPLPGPSMALLRLARATRLLRLVRISEWIPDLHAMVRGFLSAMKSMLWGFVLIFAFLLFFSVLCVELLHPFAVRIHRDDPYCLESFSGVWDCILLFFQILVANDEFGRCAMPIMKDQAWTFAIFSTAYICVQLGFMNLILAVIVDMAEKAKQEDEEERNYEKRKASERATAKLSKICEQIDTDGSGTLSINELLEGYDGNAMMQSVFKRLDMTRDDVEMLFDLMDLEKQGELNYEYFIDNVRSSQLDDSRKSLSMLRLQVAQIARHCSKLTGVRVSQVSDSHQVPRQASPRSVGPYSQRSGENKSPRSPGHDSPRSMSTDMIPAKCSMMAFIEQASQSSDRHGTLQAFSESLDAELAEMRNSIVKLINSAFTETRSAQTGAGTLLGRIAVLEDNSISIKPDLHKADVGEPPINMESSSSGGGLFDEQRADAQSAASTHVSCSGNGQDSGPSSYLKVAAMVGDKTLQVNQGRCQGEVSL